MKTPTTYHFEVYLNYRGIGWFLAGYRETSSEAEVYRTKLVSDDGGVNIKDSKIKRKRNREQFISVSL